MEVKKELQREYDPAHPNFGRWQKAREISKERAGFVESLISENLDLEKLLILDLGAGEGVTSILLSKKNIVVSVEPKKDRIKKIPVSGSLKPIMADSSNLPFKNSVFDLIILQDVIEHLIISEKFVDALKNILKANRLIYISTPNKFSFINIISDPHWGMPLLCLFKRNQIKKLFLKNFRMHDYDRNDIAELFSLNDIINLFVENFSINIYTKFSVNYLLDGGEGLVWSKFHLRLVKLFNTLGLSKIIRSIATDRIGIINKFFTPTFYIILKKK
jgi:SAM-dependent methyltransferase